MSNISDFHSIDCDFSDIEIEIDGVHVGFFDGTAELFLNSQEDEDFYVKAIHLDGVRKVQRVRSYGYKYFDRVSEKLTLARPDRADTSFKAELFRKLDAAISSDDD